MDAKEKDLLIEIHVTTDDGQEKNFTGYPVAPGRVLTARHGLLPDMASDAKAIELRWHELDAWDERRRWRPATVIWEDDPLDAALLQCDFPDGLNGYGWLSDQPPRETNPPTRWASAGIARAGDKSATASGSFDFHGNVYSAASSKLRFDIGVEDEASKGAYWEGSSGMPIFVERRIIGVVMSYCEATEARRFKASPVRLMLRDPKFRAAIGYDERERRREEAHAALSDLLVASGPVRTALGEALKIAEGDPNNRAGALADKLLESEIDEVIQTIYKAWDRLGGQRCRAEDRAVICEIIGLILPVRYDEGVIDCARVRCFESEAVLLELPSGIVTVAEVIMAGIHGRPARFKPLRDRDTFPEGADALSEPPESGFDSDGSAYERNVHAHLCNKLLAGDETSFDTFLANTFIKEAPTYRTDGVKESELAGMVADELEDRATRHNRHFYFVFKLPGRNAERPVKMVAVENLKSRYRPLDFVVLGHAGDGSIIRQERKRFGMLREILPGTTENKP
ncbi:MAG: hypothetical protein P9E88_14000 [Candidatus Competibacter sp.]|jgi:hypothetical protein|nr:hypothetical protein [Candidatus Competibacter sp.]